MPKDTEDKRDKTRQEKKQIRSMREAVEEMRSYGEKETPEKTEKRPSHKKKRTGIDAVVSFLSLDRHSRRSGKRTFTVFGRQLKFWPVFLGAFVAIMIVVALMSSSNLTSDSRNITLIGLEPDLENFKLLVLSDLNGRRFGDEQSTLLREINTLNYDIVVCLGDMVGKNGDPEPFYELLEGLPSSKKVYFIHGDSDPGPLVKNARATSGELDELVLSDWILGAVSRGAVYVDTPTQVTVGTTKFWLTPSNLMNIEASSAQTTWKDQTAQEESGYLAGIQADAVSLPFTTYRYKVIQSLYNSIAAMSDKDINIVLAHVPPSDDTILAAQGHAADSGKYLIAPNVILAGHNCGGVWNLPIVGTLYIPDSTTEKSGWLPKKSEVSGLSEIGDTVMYISKGLSTCGDMPLMPFRLLNNPEVSVITLTATLPSNILDN